MTETLTGRAACVLLALVWLVSMSVGDANAYSYVPMLAGLALVILLALSAMIRGAKVVRMSMTGWCSLAVGVYFLVRCLCSFSVVESWREASIILGCGVFYVAGVYAAQGRNLRPVLTVLTIAIVLNVLAFVYTHATDLPMEWLGRPLVGPGGLNHRPVTLFVYKNFAGTFLLITGMTVCALAWWARLSFMRRALLFLIGGIACYVATCCGTRSIYMLPPLMIPVVWTLWVVLRLYAEEKNGMAVYLSGFIIIVAVCVGIALFLLDPGVFSQIVAIDSHSRFEGWKDVCRFLPDAPLWGYGASSVQWLVLPYFCANYSSLNYAHNEYLQAWADYGVLGIAAMLGVLVVHLVRAFRVLGSEHTTASQRLMTVAAALVLIGWSVSSFVDFFWHNFAIAGMTAFSSGILASPYASAVRGRIKRPIPAGVFGKAPLALFAVAGCSLSIWLISLSFPVWVRQWEFNALSRVGADEDGTLRRAMIAELLPDYPSPALTDQYVRIPRSGDPWQEDVRLFRIALQGNPRQLCTVTMLGKTLTDHGLYEEAELLYRRYYPGDGPQSTLMMDWVSFYSLNLLSWGQACMAKGDVSGAYSRLAYGVNITKKTKFPAFDRTWRSDEHVWEVNGKLLPHWGDYVRHRQQDVSVMEQIGATKDDSWMQPMEPGGKPSLYRRLGLPEVSDTPQRGQ